MNNRIWNVNVKKAEFDGRGKLISVDYDQGPVSTADLPADERAVIERVFFSDVKPNFFQKCRAWVLRTLGRTAESDPPISQPVRNAEPLSTSEPRLLVKR
jgi:hypothetical protein